MKPDFNDEENFVIAFYRDKNASSTSRLNLLDSARALVAIGFFIYGIVGGDLVWSIIAFGILLFGDVRRIIETSKYMRLFRSILTKYDAALTAATSETQTCEQGGADRPATALVSKSEGDSKPKSDSEGCPQ